MKTILYLCHRIPYPPNKGDKIRSFNEIKFLSKTNTIDLVTLADDPKDLKYAEVLKKYCRQVTIFSLDKKTAALKGLVSLIKGLSISQGYFYKKEFQSAFDRMIDLQKYDALICFSSPMAEYVFKSSKSNPAELLIMDFCDLDSDKWNQYAENKSFPLNRIYKKEAVRLLAFEKKINQHFHRSVFVSRKEADLFKAYYPQAVNIDIIPNGVDADYFNPETGTDIRQEDAPVISFFGAMDYYANVDGVQWFSQKILPLIRKKIPDIRFYIVGSNPDPKLKALAADPGIKVTGFVRDIRPYYVQARVCVIPLRIARGVQNKVLEAMSMEKAIVSTSQAVQGIDIHECSLLKIEDDPNRFADQVIALLGNDSLRQKMGQAARQHIQTNFNWDINMKNLMKDSSNSKKNQTE